MFKCYFSKQKQSKTFFFGGSWQGGNGGRKLCDGMVLKYSCSPGLEIKGYFCFMVKFTFLLFVGILLFSLYKHIL